jgi:hypothetical protein
MKTLYHEIYNSLVYPAHTFIFVSLEGNIIAQKCMDRKYIFTLTSTYAVPIPGK